MSRKWLMLALIGFAAACGGDDDDLEELDSIDAEEQVLPPAAPMDTTMMQVDTMRTDTMRGDTMRR